MKKLIQVNELENVLALILDQWQEKITNDYNIALKIGPVLIQHKSLS